MKIKYKIQENGAALLFFVIFFVLISSTLTLVLSRTAFSDLAMSVSLQYSKQAYITGESALEDVVFKMMSGNLVSGTTTLTTLSGIATTSVTYDSANDVYIVRSFAKTGRANKVSVVVLEPGLGSAFNYGLQTGNGGFSLTNSASIIGNAFSNGTVVGQGSSLIRGDVISAGPTGLIQKITATGTAWANTLDQSTISGDAHYNLVGSPSTVGGTRYTPTTVIAPAALPILDAEVEEWKTDIQNTGTIIPASACTAGVYKISSNTTLGNIKFECDLEIKKTSSSVVVTLTGPVWVTGNIEFLGGPTMQVSPALGRKSVQIIADNPTNRLTSSQAYIRNGTQFIGSGHPSSFIMVLSQNNSAETGGTQIAIDIGQSSNGALLVYAGHGLIEIGNSIFLRSVTGYKTNIGNNSEVSYDTGLANVLFTGGPGGDYNIRDWYQE